MGVMSNSVLTTYGMGSISGGIALCIGTSAPIAQEADNASKMNVEKRPMVNKQSRLFTNRTQFL
jgi:hypothetical protein